MPIAISAIIKFRPFAKLTVDKREYATIENDFSFKCIDMLTYQSSIEIRFESVFYAD